MIWASWLASLQSRIFAFDKPASSSNSRRKKRRRSFATAGESWLLNRSFTTRKSAPKASLKRQQKRFVEISELLETRVLLSSITVWGDSVNGLNISYSTSGTAVYDISISYNQATEEYTFSQSGGIEITSFGLQDTNPNPFVVTFKPDDILPGSGFVPIDFTVGNSGYLPGGDASITIGSVRNSDSFTVEAAVFGSDSSSIVVSDQLGTPFLLAGTGNLSFDAGSYGTIRLEGDIYSDGDVNFLSSVDVIGTRTVKTNSVLGDVTFYRDVSDSVSGSLAVYSLNTIEFKYNGNQMIDVDLQGAVNLSAPSILIPDLPGISPFDVISGTGITIAGTLSSIGTGSTTDVNLTSSQSISIAGTTNIRNLDIEGLSSSSYPLCNRNAVCLWVNCFKYTDSRHQLH